jgi:photosystem II stability/assembly factor-like uncharacterized protein/PKD repeat protein
MKNSTRIILILLLLAVNFLHAQESWIRMMKDPNVNFYDVQKAFYKQYPEPPAYNLKEEDESEYMMFKRLEYNLLPRVYPTGKLPDPTIAWREISNYRRTHQLNNDLQKHLASNTWMPLGPDTLTSAAWSPGIGRINVVNVDPTNSNKIYIGAPSGGLWKSTDGGLTWITTTDNEPVLGVSGIAVNPFNSNTIYISTGDDDAWDTYSIGILKSTDGGATWNTTGFSYNVDSGKKIFSFAIDPVDSNTLFLGTNSGIYKTIDGAATWNLVSTVEFVDDIKFKPGDHNTIYACALDFLVSTDNGNSFTAITAGLPSDTAINRLKIAVTPANPSAVYVIAGNPIGNSFYGLYYSNNSGNSFVTQSTSPNVIGYAPDGSSHDGQDWYTLSLAVSPTNANEVYAGGVNIWKSLDGGVTWALNAFWETQHFSPVNVAYVHADIHTLVFYGNTLFSGCDGGVWKTMDHGNTWINLSNGIENTEFYRLGTTNYNPALIYAGAQDNGIIKFNTGNWSQVQGADGMVCRIDYTNYNNVYVSFQDGYLLKSGDGGQTFATMSGTITENGGWVTPMEIDPVNPNTLYAAYQHVWKSTNGGISWDTLHSAGNNFTLTTMAIAKSNPGYIYIGNNNHILRTIDGGNTWVEVTNNLPADSIAMTSIAVDPYNPDIVYATFTFDHNGQKVYKTVTGGIGVNAWTNISGTLPNIPIDCIAIQQGGNHGLYIGTDVGIYYTDTTMTDWIPFSNGLPNVRVPELSINYTSNTILAATYGRGIWQCPLFVPSVMNPVAYFYADKDTICPGQSIHFSDQSLYDNNTWNWSFTGGNISTSNLQNPVVSYSNTGIYPVTLWVTNGTTNDTLTKTSFIHVINPASSTLPVTEDFEDTLQFLPGSWTSINPTNSPTWSQSNFGAYGASLHSAYFSNYNYTCQGDALETPAIDIPATGITKLTFDVAYCSQTAVLSDTLIINATNDCGNTFTNVYYKGGSILATAPQNLNEFFPADTQWRTETVNLNALSGMAGMQFQFLDISGFGNDLYIDNINISWSTGLPSYSLNSNVKIYPNPVKDELIIDWEGMNANALNITVYNTLGEMLYSEIIPQNSAYMTKIDVSEYAQGLYFVRLSDGTNVVTRKVAK